MENRTKIICTIGPASEDRRVISKMIASGMDCVRLNFSHGTYDQFTRIIKNVRSVAKELGREIAIIQDLQGPKIRVGEMPATGIEVLNNQSVILTTDDIPGTINSGKTKSTLIPIQYKHLPRDVKKGDVILIDDGLIELHVVSVNSAKTEIDCKVIVGGVIKSHKGINVPTASLSANPLSEKDREDLMFGIKSDVDYIALSFVRDEKNIADLRDILRKHKCRAKIIAKIERHEAITRLEEIIKATDAVMVARGDLGVELPAEQVPLHQKKIIQLSNIYGKPVIVATQMLDSMVTNARATRAEISDAATAIFDHADALMLSNETAVGKYPVEATHTLFKVATAVERDLAKHQELLNLAKPETMQLVDATCLNACKLAHDIGAKFIVAITRSGYTTREIAKYRPFIPIITFTPYVHVQRELALVWGATHSFAQYIHLDNPLTQIRETLIKHKLVKKGDEIVVCNAGFGKKEKLITTTLI